MKKYIKRQSMLVIAAIALCFTACKKDKPATPAPTPIDVVNLTIDELKTRSTAASVTVTGDHKVFKIKGIVTSNATAKNINAKTLVLQEGNDKSAIIINFAANHTFAVGDEVQIGVSNQKLEQLNGEIVLNAIPLDSAKKTGTGSITPKETTIADINTNKAAWNGRLVRIGSGKFSGGSGKFTGTLDYTDVNNAIIKSEILAGASFETSAYPDNLKGLVGIVRLSGTEVRLNLRNTTDGENVFAYVLTEDFQSLALEESAQGNELTVLSGKISLSPTYLVSSGGADMDKAFLTPGRKYLYTNYPNASGAGQTGTITYNKSDKLTGANTVSIEVAGSLQNTGFFGNTAVTLPPFLATRYFKIAINGSAGLDPTDLPYFKQLPGFEVTTKWSFSDQGIFHKLSYTLPTKAELVGFGLDPWTEAEADYFLSHTSLQFAFGKQNGLNRFAIVISKIEFSYQTKPTWAP